MTESVDNLDCINKNSGAQDTKQWQRISPIAMLYFIAKFLYGFLSNIVFLLPPLYLGYDKISSQPFIWLPVLAGLVIVLLVATFLSFYFFQYRLHDDHIEIRSGIIAKKHVNLPFSRIQNVKLEQPIYYRPFNYTCLQLDTAGSAKQEAKVVALDVHFAEQLKKEILAHHEPEQDQAVKLSSDQGAHAATSDEVVLNKRSLSDLVIHGLTNNRIWIFMGGLAPFFDDLGQYIVTFFNDLGIDIEKVFTFADMSFWQIGLYALTLTFIILLPLTLFSIAGAIISFYNFTLTKKGDRYIRRSGLFTKHEVTMRLARLQMIVRQQDWLDVLLRRINLKFEQTNAALNQYQPGAEQSRIIVPSVFPDECEALVNDVYPENQLMKIKYQKVNKRFLLRNIGFILLPLYIILSSSFFILDKTIVIAWLTPLFLFLTLLTFMRWKRWGYAKDENFIYIRKGVFGVDYYCFPIYKIQQTLLKQSWFMKKHKLCHIEFVLAAGAQTVPFIDEEIAHRILDDCLFQVESTRRSWM